MDDALTAATGVAGAIELSGLDVALGAVLVLLAGGISIAMRLGLERRLFTAALRTVVQLLLVGWVLHFVFDLDTAWAVLGIALLMIAAAAREAVARPSRRIAGAGVLAFLTLLASCLGSTVTVTALVVGTEPWYQPQYLVPLLGMALGNGLTGISLCLDQLLLALDERRDQVELELSLGATKWEAARRPLQDAIRRGMIPIINSMSVAGIVALPGMMTGQILAGADPVEAVKYQIIVMFMISGATGLGCILTALLVFRRAFNERHQLARGVIQRRE